MVAIDCKPEDYTVRNNVIRFALLPVGLYLMILSWFFVGPFIIAVETLNNPYLFSFGITVAICTGVGFLCQVIHAFVKCFK